MAGRYLGIGAVAAVIIGMGAVLYGPHLLATARALQSQPRLAAAAVTPASGPTATPTPEPASYTVKHILPIAGPMHHGDWHWDETGAPADGPVVITVDIKAQVLSIFRGGYEIGTAVIVYGADVKPTPTGVFPVMMKDKFHRSSTYGNAPMPYTLRLTNDGVSIHGSEVGPDLMTHGCIGVPTPFAAKLFDQVKVGTKVIVTNGETLQLGGAIKAA